MSTLALKPTHGYFGHYRGISTVIFVDNSWITCGKPHFGVEKGLSMNKNVAEGEIVILRAIDGFSCVQLRTGISHRMRE
jgi:hypothetical protein